MKKIKIAGLMLLVFALKGYATDENKDPIEKAYHKMVKNGVFYDGKKSPKNMPRHAVMKSFIKTIVNLDSKEYGEQINEYIFNKIGIEAEKIDKIKAYSKDALAKEAKVSKRRAVCDYLRVNTKGAKSSGVADIINSKDSQRRAVFMDAYEAIGKILSSAEMDRFEQYLITEVAANMRYIVSRKLLADSVNMQRHTKYCNKLK